LLEPAFARWAAAGYGGQAKIIPYGEPLKILPLVRNYRGFLNATPYKIRVREKPLSRLKGMWAYEYRLNVVKQKFVDDRSVGSILILLFFPVKNTGIKLILQDALKNAFVKIFTIPIDHPIGNHFFA